MTVKQHYDQHLANFYAWMMGDFDQRVGENRELFQKILRVNGGRAIDLGCGHGIQSVALASLGFSVKAVDFSADLLRDLSSKKGTYPIDIIDADVIEFLDESDVNADLIVCMGDTLTHLPSIDALTRLFALAYQKLSPGGQLIVSFRSQQIALEGDKRFIPVKSDHQRILTCFLEYFPEHVVVHDILHEKAETGWVQKVSSYSRLRLSEPRVAALMRDAGFAEISSLTSGMVVISATRPTL